MTRIEERKKKLPYEKPVVRFALLVPREAVMAVCKTSAGNGFASPCLVCRQTGS